MATRPPMTASSSDSVRVSSAAATNDWTQLILDITNPVRQEIAIAEIASALAERGWKSYPNLALMIWNSFGTIAVLLQEIVGVYSFLSPQTLTKAVSKRVCNALALLQCVAWHPDTKRFLISARVTMYLEPFLSTTIKLVPFDHLRLGSLGVIGSLVKVGDNPDIIKFLIESEMVPLCLRSMEIGLDMSKEVAAFILTKILREDLGLEHVCCLPERFFSVTNVLEKMVAAHPVAFSRLLHHIIMCYRLLANNPRGCDALRSCLPQVLRDQTFRVPLYGHEETNRALQQLLCRLLGIQY